MLMKMPTGVLVLSLVVGACTPNSTDEHRHELEMQSQRRFAVVAYNGLDAANRGLMELEQQTQESETAEDSVATLKVAQLRSEYEELSDEVDSLAGYHETVVDDERSMLRDRLLELNESVERTKFEIIDESEEFRATVERRLSELDGRIYALRSNLEGHHLAVVFDSVTTRLDELRDNAVSEINELKASPDEQVEELRGRIAGTLATLSASITDAETEYKAYVATMQEETSSSDDGSMDT